MFTEEAKNHCYNCQFKLSLETKVTRRDTCPSCMADLHCCKNCRFYDTGAHNDCRESISQWVSDKEAPNFCQHFEFRSGEPEEKADKKLAVDKLNALFSKKG